MVTCNSKVGCYDFMTDQMDSNALERLFILCDAIFIADKEFAEIAKKANVNRETYDDREDVWERYGIDVEIIRCWIKDRQIGQQDWQRRMAKKAMTTLKQLEVSNENTRTDLIKD